MTLVLGCFKAWLNFLLKLIVFYCFFPPIFNTVIKQKCHFINCLH